MNFYSVSLKASEEGHFEILKELIEKGADLEGSGHMGWTALLLGKFVNLKFRLFLIVFLSFSASRNGYDRLVKELLEKGANVEAYSCSEPFGARTSLIIGNFTVY